MQTVDNIAKLLEVSRDYVYSTEIPRLRAEIHARTMNLKESRYRAEKFNEADIYTKEDFYGLKAVTLLLQSMFGSGDQNEKESKGAKNLLAP
jgi:hypothetical protein